MLFRSDIQSIKRTVLVTANEVDELRLTQNSHDMRCPLYQVKPGKEERCQETQGGPAGRLGRGARVAPIDLQLDAEACKRGAGIPSSVP